MTTLRHAAAAIAAAFLFTHAIPASAQVVVYDPTNFAENSLTEANTLQTTINQAKQIANELQELSYEAKNLRNIPNGVWGQIQSDLAQLTQVAKVGQTISYGDANLSSEFQQMYPGYEVPANFAQAYRLWARNDLNGIQGALQVANLQSSQFASEDATFSQLQSLSDGAAGQMQAVQAGNMVAIAQVQQLEKLRQLQMAQMQGELSYIATQQQNDLVKFAVLNAWVTSQSTYKSSE